MPGVDSTGLAVGLKKGFLVEKRTITPRPASRKGVRHPFIKKLLRWTLQRTSAAVSRWRRGGDAFACDQTSDSTKLVADRIESEELIARCDFTWFAVSVLFWDKEESGHACGGKQGKHVKFVREIVREIAGMSPLERRAVE
eukprot:344552-Rhodomonas_salina.1